MGSAYLLGGTECAGMMKAFEAGGRWWLPSIVDVLHATETNTFKWLILYNVNFILP